MPTISARLAFGLSAEWTSIRSRRSSDGQLPRGRRWREQYLGMMYSSSPATQSPRTPPAFQLIPGWKVSSAHAGSFSVNRPAQASELHGGGGETADTSTCMMAARGSLADGTAATGGGGGDDDSTAAAPAAADRLARAGTAKLRSSDGGATPPEKFSRAR